MSELAGAPVSRHFLLSRYVRNNRGQYEAGAAPRKTQSGSTKDAYSATKREIRRETYSTSVAKVRSICALFAGLRLHFMVLGVIR